MRPFNRNVTIGQRPLSLMGKVESFANYPQQVELSRQVATLNPAKRAPALILHTFSVARKVCMAAGGDVIMSRDGVEKISELLSDHFAPEAADSVYQEVVLARRWIASTCCVEERNPICTSEGSPVKFLRRRPVCRTPFFAGWENRRP